MLQLPTQTQMIDNKNWNTSLSDRYQVDIKTRTQCPRVQYFLDLTYSTQNKNKNLSTLNMVTYQEDVRDEIDAFGLLDER